MENLEEAAMAGAKKILAMVYMRAIGKITSPTGMVRYAIPSLTRLSVGKISQPHLVIHSKVNSATERLQEWDIGNIMVT